MQVYLVGGAVRDALLGLPVQDRDWVVVGADVPTMLAAGFTAVGRDFPVFLHPTTHEEYALARTERKSAPGYHGFVVHAAPDVTLQDDLARRDFTINSIAVHADITWASGQFHAQIPATVAQWHAQGRLVDPYGGQADLRAGVFRHVGPAFAEDPVRILRLARFAARFGHFTVAPDTQALLAQMVHAGEVDHLVPERVWQELARGLMQATPSRMLEVLRSCGALVRLLPELDRLWGVPQRADYHPEVDTGAHMALVLDMAAQLQAPLPVRVACLFHDLGKGTTPAQVLPRHIGHEGRSVALLRAVCQRLRVPTECKELAELVAAEHSNIHRSTDLGAAALVRLLQRGDAFRKPQRFLDALLACECDARGRLGLGEQPYPQRPRLASLLATLLAMDTKSIAAHAQSTGAIGPEIAQAVERARAQHAQAWLTQRQANATALNGV
jgi:tRNA nucleotidyltransferase (CCA-adding enzyme)